MLIKVQIYNDLASPVENTVDYEYRRQSTTLPAIHVRLIQASILLHRNRRDVVDGTLSLPLDGSLRERGSGPFSFP
jgi:hypothetical protein